MELAIGLARGRGAVEKPEPGFDAQLVTVAQLIDQRFEIVQAALGDLAELREGFGVDGAIGHGVTLQEGRLGPKRTQF